MKGKRDEIFNEIDGLLKKSKADLYEVDAILKKIKKEAFADYRRQFKRNDRGYMQ